ncbi:ankyrin repeat-containing domain protein [Aspergillus pseudoustus]|uniref:Ankyrin repeat-containing domain protein n=1 Tax=Aspergillus pseudoustus TaxID=1810923 RepID=A0ABR4JD62_9EURO
MRQYAIEGGSLEVVQFLHSVGANVNSPSGRFQSSPLEWAFNHRQLEIARFLLSCGAEIDYLCTRGWTAVQHLYWPSRTWRSGHSSTQFLSMLCAQSFSEFNTQDAAGAAAIHRAASWGTAEDVRSLLQVGASPSVRTPGRGWTPAFYAASCNNVGALRELAACQSGGFLEHLDNKGRTMLHVALKTKSSDAVRFVLAQGADPHAVLSDKRWSDVRTIIDDKHTQVSAAGLALQVGGETCTAFIQGLKDAGHDVTVSAQDDAEGLFWPAEEAL